MALLAADLCEEHSSLVDDHSNTGTHPRTCHAHRDICSPVGFFLDQRLLGAFAVGLFFLTCPADRVHSELLAKVAEEQSGRQTGGVLRMLPFHEEAIPAHQGNAVLDSSVEVLLAVNVLPCEQIQQVSRVVPLADVLSRCLLLEVLEVFLRVLTGWNSAGHSAVGESHETPEQSVMLLPSPLQPLFVAGEYRIVGLSSPAFASLILPVAQTFPVFHAHSVLLGRIVEELNGRQTGDAPQMQLFLEEAIPAHRENAVFDSSAAVHLAASVPPCEQVQQVFWAVPLADVPSLCLLLLALGVSLHLPTG